jgi:MFS family permease
MDEKVDKATMLDNQTAGETSDSAVAVPAAALRSTYDVEQIEAPVTWKAYLICAFASFGGIFFGYDTGYVNGVTGAAVFIEKIDPGMKTLTSSHNSLIVSILSAGTFFGALIAGDVAERMGRKWTVILGCVIYLLGVVIEMITGAGSSSALGVLVAGRLIAGIGAGFESAIVILYLSEIVRMLSNLEPSGIHTNLYDSAPGKSEVLLSRATNSASPLVFF